MNPLPFQDLKVIELASVLAGPSVGMFLAELGASVLKIEAPPHGDVTRSWKLPDEPKDSRTPAYFSSVNWGKSYLSLDLRQADARQAVYRRIPETDIILVSYKPGDALKLGMDWPVLSALNPKLIYGEISGYGADSDRVGYDAIIQAEAGFTYMNGEQDGPPVKMPVALMDILAAHQLKAGILTALYQREKTGLGDYIQVSLIQAGIASLANQASNYLMTGHVPGRMGSSHPNIVPYGTLYLCRDGRYIVLAVGTDKQFNHLMVVLGLSHVAGEERFATNPLRVQHRTDLELMLRDAIALQDREELLTKLHARQVPAGGVNTLAEVFETQEGKALILEAGNSRAVRTAVFQSQRFEWRKHLESPGELG